MTTPKKLPEGIRRTSAGKYQARYSVTRNGVTKQVSAGAYTTLAEAKAARQVAMVQLREGGWVDPSGPRTSVAAWATEWVELTGASDKRTESFLRVHILPQWGHRRLGDIEVADVQRWVNQLYGSDLAPTSAAAIYATFKRMMARAVDYDRLAKTPCRLIKLPSATKKKHAPLLAGQVRSLEQAVPPRYAAMVHLAAWSGLRWQECAGLQWEDVDLELGVLHVRHAVKANDGGLGTTKNGKARDVVLAPSAVDVLRAHRRDYASETFVFTGDRGGMLNYSSFMHHVWRPAVKRAGLEPMGFHSLRHAYVGHMVMQDVDWKVLSEQVGHHSPSFTADVYGWRRPDYRDRLVEAITKAQES